MENLKVSEENIRNIYKLASKLYGAPKEDLVQAGYIGLYKAMKTYNSNMNTKLSTHAYKYIFGEMYLLTIKSKELKISKDILKMYKIIEKTRYEKAQEFGYIPDNYEIANILNMNVDTINYAVASGYLSVSMDDSNGFDRSLCEVIPYEETMSMDDKIMIDQAIEFLDKNERDIIVERYYKDETQSNIARKLKMTQVMVSRLEKKAVNKMREYMST